MLRFGMPTLIGTETLESCAALCGRLGLDFIELNMNLPMFQPYRIDVPAFRETADRYGIFYTFHLDENFNVSDFNPHIAEGYRRTAAETIALAKQLDVPVINMHLSPGVYFTLPDRKVELFSVYREQYLESMAGFRTLCEESVGDAPLKICVENCGGFPDWQKEALDLLLESPVFGLTFDVGHNHSCGGLDGPYIAGHIQSLCHMHLHDARGKKHHLPLGCGELNPGEYLALAGERNCRVVLETKTPDGLEQSVRWLRGRGISPSGRTPES